jgi:hypothetical protein
VTVLVVRHVRTRVRPFADDSSFDDASSARSDSSARMPALRRVHVADSDNDDDDDVHLDSDLHSHLHTASGDSASLSALPRLPLPASPVLPLTAPAATTAARRAGVAMVVLPGTDDASSAPDAHKFVEKKYLIANKDLSRVSVCV